MHWVQYLGYTTVERSAIPPGQRKGGCQKLSIYCRRTQLSIPIDDGRDRLISAGSWFCVPPPSIPLVPSLAKTAASLRGWRSPRVPPPRQPPALEPTMQLPVWPHLPPPSVRLFAGEAGGQSTRVCFYDTCAWVFSSTRCCVSFPYTQNARVCWPPLPSRLVNISGTGERVER